MENEISLILSEKEFNDLISEVYSANIFKLAEKISNLNNYVWRKLCKKDYLSKCEPEYCSYRYTNTCLYLRTIRIINEKFGIDLIDKTINKKV